MSVSSFLLLPSLTLPLLFLLLLLLLLFLLLLISFDMEVNAKVVSILIPDKVKFAHSEQGPNRKNNNVKKINWIGFENCSNDSCCLLKIVFYKKIVIGYCKSTMSQNLFSNFKLPQITALCSQSTRGGLNIEIDLYIVSVLRHRLWLSYSVNVECSQR